ncbi:M23 family metallopeptidase [Nocardioides sp.]|uniref:M23 family metallopeptidase n=1 Tax=Nocardioides sp. TaxID=35761 RepID=UPI0035119204
MGHHRADRRAPRRRPSDADRAYVGKRVAGRPAPSASDVAPSPDEFLSAVAAPAARPAAVPVAPAPAAPPVLVTAPEVLPARPARVSASAAGKRRAGSASAAPRRAPGRPAMLGLATLAVAVVGAVTTTGPSAVGAAGVLPQASAMTGSSGLGSVDVLSGRQPSRSSDRDTLAQATDRDLVAAAQAQVEQRNATLGQLAAQAEEQARKIEENRWILPLTPSIITATFGEYGLWSSYHTGLDFNGENGDPISNIAAGTVTFVGYDGSYGNKTVVTLPDGTEIWYCHQTDQFVSVGDTVAQGETIGTVGSTGNVTGSHLHIEVRPGGGDPVDPYPAFVVHGVTP